MSKGAVSAQDGPVGACGQALAQGGLCRGRPHGDEAQLGAVLLLDGQGGGEGVAVQGVQNGGYAGPDEVARLGVHPHLVHVRDLFYAN